MNPTQTTVFLTSTTTEITNSWEIDTVSLLFPTNAWFFLAQVTDVSASIQYGFRYYLGSSSAVAPTTIFYTRGPPSGAYHVLTSAAFLNWTNDVHQLHCDCKMRYVRLYTDFVPSSQDMMISLALMDPNSKVL